MNLSTADVPVAVVTGATGAIGRATADLLAQSGMTVAAIGRNPERLAALDATPGVAAFAADCTDAGQLGEVAQVIEQRMGRATALFTFAGGAGFPVPTAEETIEHWRAVLESDLTATFATIHAFLPALTSHPASSIVTMSSAVARKPGRSNAAYAAAKSGVVGLTRHLAAELLPQGVRVNCLAPGAVENDRMAAMPPHHREQMAARLPFGRAGEAAEVARAAAFLASPLSGTTTGTVLDLGGAQL